MDTGRGEVVPSYSGTGMAAERSVAGLCLSLPPKEVVGLGPADEAAT